MTLRELIPLSTWSIVLLSAVVLIVAFLYHRFHNYRATIVFLFSAFGGLVALSGLLQGAAQNSETAKQQKETAKHQRVEVSFRYMERAEEEKYREAFKEAASVLETVKTMPPEKIQQYWEKHEKDRLAVLTCMNFFEDMALAIRTGYADERALYGSFSEMAVRYYGSLQGWIQYYRQTTGRTGAHAEHEWLWNRWKGASPSFDTSE